MNKEKSSSLFLFVLSEISQKDNSVPALINVLKCLESSLNEKCYDDDELPLIALFLHRLYTISSTFIKTYILRICFQLEVISEEVICEKYNFDYLIVSSLEQKTSSKGSKCDDEKLICFSYIMLLFQYKKHVPLSIIRSLIALYNSPQRQFKGLILNMLEQYILLKDMQNLPEIDEIINEDLNENLKPNIINVIGYGFEHRLSFAKNRLLMSHLISPLTQNTLTSASCEKSCQAIASILSTWPGLLVFGLEMNAIKNLIMCLPHKTNNIIQIFRKIIIFKDDPKIITNSFCGFFMKILINSNFLSIINYLSKNYIFAASFYNTIVPFVSKYVEHKPQKPGKNVMLDNEKMREMYEKDVYTHVYYKPKNTDIFSYQLPSDPNKYDWNIIYLKICMLSISKNIIDDQKYVNYSNKQFSVQMKAFITKLLKYYSDNFTSIIVPNAFISECFINLMENLTQSDWGMNILYSADSLKNAFASSIRNLYQDADIDPQSPTWVYLKSLSHLMSTLNGMKILTKYELLDPLRKMGEACKNLKTVQKILSMIRFEPDGGWAIPVYGQFMKSEDKNIESLSIKELRNKFESTSYSKFHLLTMLLIPHIKLQEKAAINEPLGLLNELIHSDMECFNALIADKQIISIIKEHDHIIYSYILSKCSNDKLMEISDEEIMTDINWWIQKGNTKYLKVYDAAVQYSFTNDEDLLTQYPSIVTENKLACIPPHLFSQLTQSKHNLKILSKFIPYVLKNCSNKSVKKQRASFFALAHFASNPQSAPYVCEHKITETLISEALKSSSYILKGTLINCLSLFSITDEISNILQQNQFEIFTMGKQQIVVPKEITMLLPKVDEKSSEKQTKYSPPNADNIPSKFADAFIELLNPITAREAQEFLSTSYVENFDSLSSTPIGIYAHKLISYFSFPIDTRSFILNFFKQTVLYNEDINVDICYHSKAESALMKAKLFHFIQQAQYNQITVTNIEQILGIEIPVYSIDSIKNNENLFCVDVPEVYLNDRDFSAEIGMSRDDFYSLDNDQKQEIRHRITQ